MTVTPADAARLLAVAAAFDRRTVGKAEAIAWADVLQELEPQECERAIRAHYAETSAFLMPAHVRTRVKAIRDAAAEREHNKTVRREIEAGEAKRDAETARRGHDLVMRTLAEARGWDNTAKADFEAVRRAQAVPCPWCKASPGMACRNFDRASRQPHPSRVELAAKGAAA